MVACITQPVQLLERLQCGAVGMEERTTHRSVRDRSQIAVPAHSSVPRHQAQAMPPSAEEVQLLYERVERLGEQASIAEQLQRENDDLRAEVQELRGTVRALRRENTALHSKERVDASDMVPHCLRLALDCSPGARVPQRCRSQQDGCVRFRRAIADRD